MTSAVSEQATRSFQMNRRPTKSVPFVGKPSAAGFASPLDSRRGPPQEKQSVHAPTRNGGRFLQTLLRSSNDLSVPWDVSGERLIHLSTANYLGTHGESDVTEYCKTLEKATTRCLSPCGTNPPSPPRIFRLLFSPSARAVVRQMIRSSRPSRPTVDLWKKRSD